MTAIVFDNSDNAGDAPYLGWLHEHPFGLIVNTRRRFDPTYLVLHRAVCVSIRQAARQVNENPFVGRNFIKVCSDSEADLLTWIRQNGGKGFSKRCSLCGS